MDNPIVPPVSSSTSEQITTPWHNFIRGGVIGVGVSVLAYILILPLTHGFNILPFALPTIATEISYTLIYAIPLILTEIFDAGYSSYNSSSFLIDSQYVTMAGFVVVTIYYFFIGGLLGLFYRYRQHMVAGTLCLACAGILIGTPYLYWSTRSADPPQLFTCRLIANEQTRQSCLSKAQVRTGNPVNCEQFNGDNRDYCFYGFALDQNDPEFCRQMNDEFVRDGCLNLVFGYIKYKDTTLLDCLSFTNETYFNSCIVGLANRDHNTELCSYLKNAGSFWNEQCQSSLPSNIKFQFR